MFKVSRSNIDIVITLPGDFKLGMGVVNKADKDWRGIGPPQVASQLPHFL